MIDRT